MRVVLCVLLFAAIAHGSKNCGDVKAEYQHSGCCGASPDKPLKQRNVTLPLFKEELASLQNMFDQLYQPDEKDPLPQSNLNSLQSWVSDACDPTNSDHIGCAKCNGTVCTECYAEHDLLDDGTCQEWSCTEGEGGCSICEENEKKCEECEANYLLRTSDATCVKVVCDINDDGCETMLRDCWKTDPYNKAACGGTDELQHCWHNAGLQRLRCSDFSECGIRCNPDQFTSRNATSIRLPPGDYAYKFSETTPDDCGASLGQGCEDWPRLGWGTSFITRFDINTKEDDISRDGVIRILANGTLYDPKNNCTDVSWWQPYPPNDPEMIEWENVNVVEEGKTYKGQPVSRGRVCPEVTDVPDHLLQANSVVNFSTYAYNIRGLNEEDGQGVNLPKIHAFFDDGTFMINPPYRAFIQQGNPWPAYYGTWTKLN